MARYILLVLLVVSFFVAIISKDANKLPTKTDKKLVKTFAKFNDYLEKKVNSDDLETNIEAAKGWLNDKSKLSLLLDRSFKEELRQFISLPEMVRNATICSFGESSRLLKHCEEGLSDEARLNNKNYPLQRIDRLLETVAYRRARLCRLTGDSPSLGLIYKEISYDRINEDLIDRTSDKDPEANMRVAKEILDGLDNQEGSYAAALKQFLALKSISTDDSCDEQALEIVMKNDLATRGKAHTRYFVDQRRIGQIVNYYSQKHSTVCLPIYQKNLLALLEQVDLKTFKTILALASSFYLEEEQFPEMMLEVEQKQLGDEFSTQLVANKDNTIMVFDLDSFSFDQFLGYLRAAAVKDPRAGFLGMVVDERSGERVLRSDKIRELYDDYMYKPCEKFYNLLKYEMEIFDYNKRVTRYATPLNFRLFHSAFHTCRHVISYHERYLRGIESICKMVFLANIRI